MRAPLMALGVIDEQHRFGVMQRLSLQPFGQSARNTSPLRAAYAAHERDADPRSLAMVLYGDMEVSFVDEMPPGRTPIQTKVFSERERNRVYALVLEELKRGSSGLRCVAAGRASEQLQQVRDATQMAEKMRETLFKDFGVGFAHGRMKAEERDRIMRYFATASSAFSSPPP